SPVPPRGSVPAINALGSSTPSHGTAAFGASRQHPPTIPQQAVPTAMSAARMPAHPPQVVMPPAQASNVHTAYLPPVIMPSNTTPSQPTAIVPQNPVTTMPPPGLPTMPPAPTTPDRANDIQLSEEVVALRRRIHSELLKNLDFA